jgi:hypothetical protein
VIFQLNERVDVLPEVGEVIEQCVIVGRTLEGEPRYDVMTRTDYRIIPNVPGKYIRAAQAAMFWDS